MARRLPRRLHQIRPDGGGRVRVVDDPPRSLQKRFRLQLGLETKPHAVRLEHLRVFHHRRLKHFVQPQAAQKDFASYIATIRNGMSLRKWMQAVALPAFQIDPMGLIFMEVDPTLTKTGKQQPYPTYKSTGDIFDYKLNGRRLEYVIFKLSKKDVKTFVSQGITVSDQMQMAINQRPKKDVTIWYRVVDDTTDRVFEYDGKDTITEIGGLRLPNYFMEVPAMIISDIVAYNSDQFLSPDDLVVELANDYLTDCSVFNIWKKLHGFPKQWRVRSSCSTCMGTTKIQGRMCPDCSGTGYRKVSTVRDEIIIPMPEAEDGSTKGSSMPTKVFGYETPDIQGWDKMTGEMDHRLFSLMFETIWGTCPQQKTAGPSTSQQRTATEAVMDVQAMNERLHDFSEWAQTLESFIIDKVGQLQYTKNYEGASVNYGNRYAIEGPDVIFDKYKNARSSGAPKSTLDGLLRDYYESRYESSPMDLAKALKLMRIEPFLHKTDEQVAQMTLTDLDKASKNYFDEWLSTLDDMDILGTKDEPLRQMMLDYAALKLTTIKQEEAALIALQQPADGLDAPVVRSTTMRINS